MEAHFSIITLTCTGKQIFFTWLMGDESSDGISGESLMKTTGKEKFYFTYI